MSEDRQEFTKYLAVYTEALQSETRCQLRHEEPEEGLPLAVEFLCIPMGYNDKEEHQLHIGLCQECLESLIGGEWVIIYCITCNASRWVHKPSQRKVQFRDSTIVLLDGCPNCTGKSSKIYAL